MCRSPTSDRWDVFFLKSIWTCRAELIPHMNVLSRIVIGFGHILLINQNNYLFWADWRDFLEFGTSTSTLCWGIFLVHVHAVSCLPYLHESILDIQTKCICVYSGPTQGVTADIDVFILQTPSSSSLFRDTFTLGKLKCILVPNWTISTYETTSHSAWAFMRSLHLMTNFHSSTLMLSLPPSPSRSLVVIVTSINTPAKLSGPTGSPPLTFSCFHFCNIQRLCV